MVAAGAYDKKRSRDIIRLPVVADIGDAVCIAVTLDEVAEMIAHLDSTVPPGELFCSVERSEMP
jgi:3-dehydroquinate synthetase